MLGILHYYICVAAGAAADTGTWHGMQASLPCTATEKGADTGTRHGLSRDLSVGEAHLVRALQLCTPRAIE
jgi:hypothetical protein